MDHVVATAGHVDHGKSTLVRTLTGMDPDRWAEEHRRGLTIDLGFVWTALPSGRRVAFVDVPGHERFLGNMLAGLGPAPVVCFVVAADEGWRPQSDDHRDAVAALGIRHGVIVLSRADRARQPLDDVVRQVRSELAGTGLADAPLVSVSAFDGTGLDELRSTLDTVLAAMPPPPADDRVRLWVDRSFTISGAGTVVTGTLPAGCLSRGDQLSLVGANTVRQVQVRGLHSRGESAETLEPVTRAAVNLRGAAADSVHRGDALITPGAWWITDTVDVRRVSGTSFGDAPRQLTVHVGTAAMSARVRGFDEDHARLFFDRALPLMLGDRLVLRDPGGRRVFGGAFVLDVDPPELSRRGDGIRRGITLARRGVEGDLAAEVARRGAVRLRELELLGLPASSLPAGVRAVGDWLVAEATLLTWRDRLRSELTELHARDPLSGGLSRGAAAGLLALPSSVLLDAVIDCAGLERHGGQVLLPGSRDELGPITAAVAAVEARLSAEPFDAPEAQELRTLGLGSRELAAAERAGRLIRLDGVVLLPSAPALAARRLAALDQPFTMSQARQALQTTRRVAVPLLEHLDGRGWTRRVDTTHREMVRRARTSGR
ncbi:selenocysteine-specific translation elongation factor [Amycolatopsis acidicola]|uniref:Selenocysteine-specific translation elongation factor n=2 Tax=Amycolatopsis acidicola TaxID=2596893 RepID=A0A5N0VF40_9PSEU|nr:selenocysteine-specific translation elongation factor [Amycolatopsis acidicola]